MRAAVVVGGLVALALGLGFAVGGPRVWGGPLAGWVALGALAVQWVAFVPAYLAQTERYYDLVGSLTHLSVVSATLGVAWMTGVATLASVLVAAAVGCWAVRLGTFLFRRVLRAGHDRRFVAIKTSPQRFLVAWTLQGMWVFVTTLAAQVVIASGGPVSAFTAVGLVLFGVGFAVEVVADRQKSVFRADPANQERFITTGLWAWSRHPNYFGEIVLWTGIWVSGLGVYAGGQWLTALSPLFVTFLLTRVSGIPMLQASAEERWGDDPAYRAYVERTPLLLPRPPTLR